MQTGNGLMADGELRAPGWVRSNGQRKTGHGVSSGNLRGCEPRWVTLRPGGGGGEAAWK